MTTIGMWFHATIPRDWLLDVLADRPASPEGLSFSGADPELFTQHLWSLVVMRATRGLVLKSFVRSPETSLLHPPPKKNKQEGTGRS